MRTHVLFDLDGTLTDSAPGITRCLAYAVTAVSGSSPELHALRTHIGTPLREIFAALLPGASSSDIEDAVSAYAERFEETGIFENSVYPGIIDALEELRDEGCKLYVATAKRQDTAERVIGEFKLDSWFRGAFGTQFDRGIISKQDVIQHGLTTFNISKSDAAMVGDRYHDIDAARALEIQAVGVAWGYGSREELIDAHAIADVPETLVSALRKSS